MVRLQSYSPTLSAAYEYQYLLITDQAGFSYTYEKHCDGIDLLYCLCAYSFLG